MRGEGRSSNISVAAAIDRESNCPIRTSASEVSRIKQSATVVIQLGDEGIADTGDIAPAVGSLKSIIRDGEIARGRGSGDVGISGAIDSNGRALVAPLASQVCGVQ